MRADYCRALTSQPAARAAACACGLLGLYAQTLVRLKRTLTLPNGLKLVKSPPGDGWFPVEVRGDQFFSEYGPEIGRKDIAEIRVSEHWNE